MKGKGIGMEFVKKGLDNQALGLLPVLLFMILDMYIYYLLSFFAGFAICFVSLLLFRIFSNGRVYQFMLLPSALTLILYAVFFCLRLEPILFVYSSLVTEILLVVSLTVVGFTRRTVLKRIRDSQRPRYQKTFLRTVLNEFYFVSQLAQNIYTLHLFAVLFYGILPDYMQSERLDFFFYHVLPILIGFGLIVYEQIRLWMMEGSLKKEMWLPVVDEKGKVAGCIARSVSRSLPKKYFHPIVRIVVLYKGMLYLVKRSKQEYVSPGTLDYPFHQYVLFRHSLEGTVQEALGKFGESGLNPRFLVRYTYEDEKVKHLVSLYMIRVQDEAQLEPLKALRGKLWTGKQIEDNLTSGIFSGYFEKEYPYLQSTVLLAEHFNAGEWTPDAPDGSETGGAPA